MTAAEVRRSGREMGGLLRGQGVLPWLIVVFVLLVFFMPALEPIFRMLMPDLENTMFTRQTFVQLTRDHLVLVGVSSLISVAVGVSAGIFATRATGEEFKPMISAIAAIGQTFPPPAVLAVMVPIAGFGFVPALVALALYGLLPVVQNTIAGMQSVSPAALEAARGMGMSRSRILFRVELPLAMRVIIAGVRVSVIVNIGTATIASTVGANSLGTPIISGLVVQNMAYITQGAVLVGLMAIITDQLFERLERRFAVGSSDEPA
ncbi:ABC transporter permease [Fodinicurvata sp. EGI_FJ10296]|uniref:ABC transporter permease n=1 Tax=Fodinicurvata sp. EGI_FJ10296 TaxID=3231908 RepID=UPI003455E5A0